MCGFAGEFILAPPDGGQPAARADLGMVRRMAANVAHRGPDERGEFLSADGRCAIAFHRLAVIDPAGSHQPMTSSDGQVTVAFNGEIYNYRQLRAELAADGAALVTAGDTETLLHLWHRLGAALVERLDGMFALAVYDARDGRLFLARDRLGQKPLWYASLADRLVFASESRALLGHPGVDRELDRGSITAYVTMGYIPSPRTIWHGVRKLPPACGWLVGGAGSRPEGYWRPGVVAAPGNREEATRAVREAAIASVRAHLVSDVPVGLLLSGGIDSGVVAAAAAAAGAGGALQTFTAGFADARYDERPLARLVAGRLGAQHTEVLIRPAPAAVLDGLVASYGEPFADSSALPAWLICREARGRVKVALTGDGGDEVFGGYDRYRAMAVSERMGPGAYAAARLAGLMARPFAPKEERHLLRRFIRFAEALPYPAAVRYLMHRRLFAAAELPRLLGPEVLAQADVEGPERWFLELYENADLPGASPADDEVRRAQRHDLLTYLPDDLLVKSDIASMSVGLELRAPFLDHRLVCLGLSLPVEWKIQGRFGKAILREAFAGDLPAEVLRAPKRGFGVPLGRWLREDLHELLRETLTDPWVYRQGILRQEGVFGLLNDHFAGRADHRHRLWALLVLARWLYQRRA